MSTSIWKRLLGRLHRLGGQLSDEAADRCELLRLRRLPHRQRQGERLVLVLEPNICHAEVVVGVVLQLQQLGWTPVVITRRWHGREAGRMLKPERGRLHLLHAQHLQRLCHRLARHSALPLLITSSHDYDQRQSIPESWGAPLLQRRHTWWIQHNRSELAQSASLCELAERGSLISLVPGRPYGNGTVLTPLFAQPKRPDQASASSQARRNFLVPGNLGRSHAEIFAAFQQAGGDPDRFQLLITGWSDPAQIHAQAAKHGLARSVVALGRVSHSRMLELVQQADVLVGPTDRQAYAGGRAVSGARQLSLSFATPLLVAEELAAEWQLPADGAITYKQDLGEGAQKALRLTSIELNSARTALQTSYTLQARESLDKLGSILGKT